MGFWGSMMGGSNPTINQGINKSGQIAGFGTTKGEGLTTAAGDFFTGLTKGDPAQIAKLLAPQISTAQNQAQQAKQTSAQFKGRSGGTAAEGQTIDDKTRAGITGMISDLTGKAAGAAASMGQNLLDTGIAALQQQVNFSQMQMQNWQNSLLGGAMGSAVNLGMDAATMGIAKGMA